MPPHSAPPPDSTVLEPEDATRARAGLHLIADLHGCAGPVALDDAPGVQALCRRAVAASGLQAVGELFHAFRGPEGQAQGVTGVVLLAESHLALHTWPERGWVTLDIYVCNLTADHRDGAERLLAAMLDAFAPARPRIRRVARD